MANSFGSKGTKWTYLGNIMVKAAVPIVVMRNSYFWVVDITWPLAL
jgi:hypothetical protein